MNGPEKKLLILYATAGSGHKKAAEAIERAAKAEFSSIEKVDVISFMPAISAKLYSDGYLFLIKHMPNLWGIIYFLSDTPILSWFNVHLRRFLNRILCSSLIEYLLKNQPDIIISTHFLASEIVSYSKLKHGLKSKLINVVTDFGVHNFWIVPNANIYCCASQATKDILVSKGVLEPNIKITGIPLDEKFIKSVDISSAARDLKVNPELFTVLVITGGIGAGPIEKIVESLKDDVQLLVVCGNNSRLQDKITNKHYPNVRVFGYVDFVERLMALSNVVVTKAGGLTITESLSMKKPMIFFFIVPGQEKINAQTVTSQGAGIIASSPIDIKTAVLSFKTDLNKLDNYSKHTASLSKPNSAREIVLLAK